MLVRHNWQLAILVVLAGLFTACTGDSNAPVTLTAQADSITAQAVLLNAQADELAAAADWSDAARVTLTAWPQQAIVTQNALLSNGATIQAQVVHQVGTEAVGTSQAMEATIRADEISVVEAIAATDLAIQAVTIEAGRYELATSLAARDILVATATQAAEDFTTELVQWQAAGTALADEHVEAAARFAQTSTAQAEDYATQQSVARSLRATATTVAQQRATDRGDLQAALATNQVLMTEGAALAEQSATEVARLEAQLATVEFQMAEAATQLASAEVQLTVDAAALATADDVHAGLLAEMTRRAEIVQTQRADWRGQVTVQAGVYATQAAELNAALSTRDTLLSAAAEVGPVATESLTPVATASVLPSLTETIPPSVSLTATASPTVTPTDTLTVTVTPSVTPTVTPSFTPLPSITPTPFLCWVLAVNEAGVNIREEPTIGPNNVLVSAPVHTVMSVTDRVLDGDDLVWYAVRLEQGPDSGLEGWVAETVVDELTDCGPN